MEGKLLIKDRHGIQEVDGSIPFSSTIYFQPLTCHWSTPQTAWLPRLYSFCIVDFLALIFPSRMSTAFTLWDGARWAYLRVIVRVLWPNSSFTVVRSTPAMTRWEAKVCLRSWNLKLTILRAFQSRFITLIKISVRNLLCRQGISPLSHYRS